MFCVVLCLYHVNQLILLLYIYGSIWVQEQSKTNSGLCCYSIWFGHVGFAGGTCLLVANISGVTARYSCGVGVLSVAAGCRCWRFGRWLATLSVPSPRLLMVDVPMPLLL